MVQSSSIDCAPFSHRVVFGSGAKAANAVLPAKASQKELISTLQAVIDDKNEVGVGGAIQYGRFEGTRFQPMGVARMEYDVDDTAEVRYWRAAIDLNHEDFVGAKLLPNFPVLDMLIEVPDRP